MNVQQLDESGRCIMRWCFMPKGELVRGDVLLAQKIALETMERKVLAVANSSSCVGSFSLPVAAARRPDSRPGRGLPQDQFASSVE
jgi:hypothetical protein